MTDEKIQKQIQLVFNTLCNVLNKHGFEYSKDEEKLKVNSTAQKENSHIDFSFEIDADRMLVLLISHIPCIVPQKKRVDLAAAISFINNFTANGCFDFDIKTGNIFFRMTNGFFESLISEEVFEYMISCSLETIDEYSEQFIMLTDDLMSFEEFFDRNGI